MITPSHYLTFVICIDGNSLPPLAALAPHLVTLLDHLHLVVYCSLLLLMCFTGINSLIHSLSLLDSLASDGAIKICFDFIELLKVLQHKR